MKQVLWCLIVSCLLFTHAFAQKTQPDIAQRNKTFLHNSCNTFVNNSCQTLIDMGLPITMKNLNRILYLMMADQIETLTKDRRKEYVDNIDEVDGTLLDIRLCADIKCTKGLFKFSEFFDSTYDAHYEKIRNELEPVMEQWILAWRAVNGEPILATTTFDTAQKPYPIDYKQSANFIKDYVNFHNWKYTMENLRNHGNPSDPKAYKYKLEREKEAIALWNDYQKRIQQNSHIDNCTCKGCTWARTAKKRIYTKDDMTSKGNDSFAITLPLFVKNIFLAMEACEAKKTPVNMQSVIQALKIIHPKLNDPIRTPGALGTSQMVGNVFIDIPFDSSSHHYRYYIPTISVFLEPQILAWWRKNKIRFLPKIKLDTSIEPSPIDYRNSIEFSRDYAEYHAENCGYALKDGKNGYILEHKKIADLLWKSWQQRRMGR